jgi:glutathione peroxidase
MSTFYDIPVQSIDGSPDLLGPLRGSVALAVNVASRCGYTRQYTGLQRLHLELHGENFTVVGFPCNQFGAQEPGSESEILRFCRTTYEVSFPMSAKLDVNGPKRHALYAFLTAATGGFPGDIAWNFEKFLIGRDGRVLKRYPSAVAPEDKGLMQDVAAAL